MMKKLLILGAGGYGKTIADVASQLNCYDRISFLDDQRTGDHILGKCEEYLQFCDSETEVYPAFGGGSIRMMWIHRLQEAQITIPSLIHPRAYVSPTAVLEEGVVVLPGAIVNTVVTVKRGCIINCGAIVDHGCVLEEGVHVCLGAIVKAENRIPRCMKIEAGEIIANRTYPV
jgi:UDP-N-acetylbacillosamine N-acetyltransferase